MWQLFRAFYFIYEKRWRIILVNELKRIKNGRNFISFPEVARGIYCTERDSLINGKSLEILTLTILKRRAKYLGYHYEHTNWNKMYIYESNFTFPDSNLSTYLLFCS